MKLSLFTVVSTRWNTDIIPHFFNYYKNKLKIENFYITLHSYPVDEDAIEKVKKTLKDNFDIDPYYIWKDEYTPDLKEVILKYIHKKVITSNDEWYLIADVDEFQDYITTNLTEFFENCNKSDINIIEGTLTERFSDDMKLKK